MFAAMNKDALCPPYCEKCECNMKLVRTIPKLGGLPELKTYRCASCGAVKTVEVAPN